MTRRRAGSLVAFALAALALAGGGGLMLATCAAGERRHVARFVPEGAGWLARLPAGPLEAGANIAVDLWLDYSGAGGVTAVTTATSASGHVERDERSWQKRGGAVIGAFRRAALWRAPDAGPWSVEVSLATSGRVKLTYGTAGVTEGAVEGVLPGAIALALGVLLGVAGFVLRG